MLPPILFMAVFFLKIVMVNLEALVPQTTDFKDCEMVPTTECSKSCDGGWQLMKYDCVETVDSCICPSTVIYNQCNNRPCLAKNATLLDVFYDAEDQAEEQSDYEYYDDNDIKGSAV